MSRNTTVTPIENSESFDNSAYKDFDSDTLSSASSASSAANALANKNLFVSKTKAKSRSKTLTRKFTNKMKIKRRHSASATEKKMILLSVEEYKMVTEFVCVSRSGDVGFRNSAVYDDREGLWLTPPPEPYSIIRGALDIVMGKDGIPYICIKNPEVDGSISPSKKNMNKYLPICSTGKVKEIFFVPQLTIEEFKKEKTFICVHPHRGVAWRNTPDFDDRCEWIETEKELELELKP